MGETKYRGEELLIVAVMGCFINFCFRAVCTSAELIFGEWVSLYFIPRNGFVARKESAPFIADCTKLTMLGCIKRNFFSTMVVVEVS